MAISKDEVKDYIKSMTVLELSELIKELENDLGVSAAAAVAAPVAAAGGGDAPAAAEQTEFDVILDAAGGQKIKVIKVLREITGLGLKDAKALADNAPSPIKEGVSKEEAESIKEKLVEQGGQVTVK